MAEPPVPADGNPSTEDPGENKPWDELFVNNPDEYFGNTNSQKESRPKIGEQNKIIVSQSIMLQEINTKLTVAEGHNSSSSTTPGISLDNYDEKMATVKQEIQDRKSEQIASDNDLAKELQESQESTKVDKKVSFGTPFKVQEMTPREIRALFSGKKNL